MSELINFQAKNRSFFKSFFVSQFTIRDLGSPKLAHMTLPLFMLSPLAQSEIKKGETKFFSYDCCISKSKSSNLRKL